MSYLNSPNDLTPPPAYSEDDFDRKTSIALALSLSPPQSHDSADGVWQDDAFEAVAQALEASKPYAQGGSSRFVSAGPAFDPLKKAAPSKPLPSWLHQLETADPPGTGGHQLSTDVDDSLTHPPPAFTSHGPSLDGPPYEQVVSFPRAGLPLVPRALPTPQVLQSRDVHTRRLRHSLPQIPRTHQATTMPQRPISQQPSHRSLPTPISSFDPSLAYRQDPNFGRSQQSARDYETQDGIHGATSLYNAVVANHLKSSSRQGPKNHVVQGAAESSVYHLSPNRGQDFRVGRQMQGMRPTQSPASPRFSQYSPYPHTTSSGFNGERQTAPYYHYGDG